MSNPIQTAITTAIAALKAHDQHHIDYDDHDGYPGSELQAQHLAAVAALESLLPLKLDGVQRMHGTLVDVIDNHCIAMQSALIDAELRGHAAGLAWIHNTLWGPGLLPDLDAARQMGGAQAWFDAKSAETDELRAKRITALDPEKLETFARIEWEGSSVTVELKDVPAMLAGAVGAVVSPARMTRAAFDALPEFGGW